MRQATPASAAITPSRLELLTHRTIDSWFGMPHAVYQLLHQVKVLDDDTLAAAMERVLRGARGDGRLSQFPALYFYRVLENLLDPHSGRKPKTADVVLRHARRAGPLDAPVQLQLADRAMRQWADAGRFSEALEGQRKVVRIVARGNHDDRAPGLWRYHRAVQDALAGAAAAQRGRAAGGERRSLQADNLFLRASLRGTSDPNVLNTVAWYRALVDWGLEEAETSARRATILEARVDNRPGANAADTLAYVLLKRGRPLEGLAVLAPRMNSPSAKEDGLFWMHMGQLYASGGDLRAAANALAEALCWDRALEPSLRTDPFLASLRKQVPIKELAQEGERLRLERR
jgi:predicted Zn-dependent protease